MLGPGGHCSFSSFHKTATDKKEEEFMRTLRKTYFVNPRLQWQLILGANVLALISVAMITTLMFYTESKVHTYGAALNLAPNHPFLAFVAQQEAYFARMCLAI